MPLADLPEESRRRRAGERIKGTDPRVKNVTDRIGRGRMEADNAAEARGSRPSDADINDAFARQLEQKTRDDSGYERYKANLPNKPKPGGARRKYIHETDLDKVESIRRSGIRPSRGGGAMGHEGVYAYEGEAAGRRVPEGRAIIEFEADPARVTGRGTGGSRTVALGGGNVDPNDFTGGYGPSGRIFDTGSALGLLGMLASFMPGVADRFPWASRGGLAGDALNFTVGQNYGPGGVMDPYKDLRGTPGFNPATGTTLA